ncbi:hypothetical protein [Sagittula stellata]|uniref:Uncharacterized protein n=1 Tax=Sagittula stellata (strain ATCC 700073 / DSM 11524 / E-37) TaxID=388399 RepID=A3KAE7_SAGS3|nr:hypothetical protein [Sagittula stellata]EBA05806.1 hypothetical protein SSE37_22322 [Sagittula stellata E-37]
MKRIAALIALLPVSAMAHGAHAPVPDSAHGLAHLAPALLVIAVAAVVARIAFRGKDDA